MKDIDTLRAAIKAQQDAIKQAQATIRQARQHMDNASTEFQRIAQGTGSPNAHGAIESTRLAHEHLTTSHGNTDAINQHLDDYLTDISGQQAWTSNDTAHPAVRNLGHRPPTPAPERGGPRTPDGGLDFKALYKKLGLDKKEFLGSALTPERITELMGKLPKMKPGHGSKTRGFWIDSDGKERQIVSGTHDHEHPAAQQYWRIIARRIFEETDPKDRSEHDTWEKWWEGLATAADVELKSIMAMNASKKKHGTVLINNPDGPCQGILSCDRLIEEFLNQDETLTVIWPGGRKIYKGKR